MSFRLLSTVHFIIPIAFETEKRWEGGRWFNYRQEIKQRGEKAEETWNNTIFMCKLLATVNKHRLCTIVTKDQINHVQCSPLVLFLCFILSTSSCFFVFYLLFHFVFRWFFCVVLSCHVYFGSEWRFYLLVVVVCLYPRTTRHLKRIFHFIYIRFRTILHIWCKFTFRVWYNMQIIYKNHERKATQKRHTQKKKWKKRQRTNWIRAKNNKFE